MLRSSTKTLTKQPLDILLPYARRILGYEPFGEYKPTIQEIDGYLGMKGYATTDELSSKLYTEMSYESKVRFLVVHWQSQDDLSSLSVDESFILVERLLLTRPDFHPSHFRALYRLALQLELTEQALVNSSCSSDDVWLESPLTDREKDSTNLTDKVIKPL